MTHPAIVPTSARRRAALLMVVLPLGCRQVEAPAPPAPSGVYAFAHPFREADLLPGALERAERIYVHDGEWGMRDGRPLVVRGQAYPEGSSRPLMLVYHGEPAFVEALADLDLVAVSAPLVRRFRDLASRGLPVAGIQVDFDAGPRGRARYPELLDALRAALPDARLSVTALLSGSDDPVWREIASRVDEVCPMLYGYDPSHPARFDAAGAGRHLDNLGHASNKLLPVIGVTRSGAKEEALAVLAGAGIGSYLLFDLRSWKE